MSRILALLAALGCVLSLFAQTHSESITVEVVDVPVYVTGPNGQPVRNLTKDDFELLVNGKRQQIDYFDPIDFTAASAAPAQAAAPVPPRDIRDRRLFLLFFDLTFSRPAALARAQKGAEAMIRNAHPGDYFASATFTPGHGIQFVSPFTADRAVAFRAVKRLRASDARDPLAVAISENERDTSDVLGTLTDGGGGGRAGDRDAEAMAALYESLEVGKDLREMPIKRLIEYQVDDLASLSKRLAQFEGYKHVVFFSEGFNSYLVTGARPNLQMGQVPDVDAHLMKVIQQMELAFHAAGAFVDTIDLGTRDANSSDMLVNESLHLLAAETGGRFIPNVTNVAQALSDLDTSTATGYRLSFNAPHDAKKGDNSIDVKVRNVPSGTRLSFRHGFSTTASKPSSSDGLRLADVILNDIPQNGIPPRIAFGERPYVEIHVPAHDLLAASNNVAVNADVLFYVFDAKGSVVEFKERQINIPASAPGEVVVRDAVHLPSGSYTAKALLRAGDSIGFAKQEFAIP